MSEHWSRRSFLLGLPTLAGANLLIGPGGALAADEPKSGGAMAATGIAPPGSDATETPKFGAGFPRTEPELVGKFVGASHGNIDEVRGMVERNPALARASWDWGFGDWETGLGAASHVGRPDIAEVLFAHGAHPTIFSAAMLGQLEVVKAFVAAMPGIQRTLGPHGITLLNHARAGKEAAAPVAAYLESLGDADQKTATQPLDPADRDALVGRYRFGAGVEDVFDVDVKTDRLGILRPSRSRGLLNHTGNLNFFPSGVPSVRIAFAKEGARVTRLTVADPNVFVTALREG